jgi:cytochrome P450
MANDTEAGTDRASEIVSQGFDLEAHHRLETADHQPFLQEYATECPVRHSPDGGLIFLRMAEIREIGRNPVATEILSTEDSPLGNVRPLIPLQLDGPIHTQYRKILDPLFTPRKMAPLESVIRTLADDLIDQFIDRREADLYGEFCAILPATIFVRLMGIPEGDIDYFMAFKDDLLRGDPEEAPEETQKRCAAAGARCYEYFNRVLDDREAAGGSNDDLIGAFINAEVDGHRLTREDILDITYLLMIAGLDTVAATLSCMISWLARHPDERQRVIDDPTMWPQVVEELLRWETPVPNGLRFASADMEVNGRKIPYGTRMHLAYGAGNLDPEVFPDPMSVKFDRAQIPHATFATGFHRCLGSHLARMELRTALDQFHRRIPDYRIRPGAELHYEALPVRLVSPLPLVWN